jgi:hypothetical protein
MTKVLTQADLSDAKCSTPGCACEDTKVYLHSRCHMEAGLNARYDRNTGALTLECAECEQDVGSFLLAASRH